MVDIKKAPFNLDEEGVKWVEETFNSLTLDEKIGQLFVVLKANPGVDENQLRNIVNETHLGGFRWQNQDAKGAYLQNTLLQKISKVPVLIAANCDDGGIGATKEGTFVATAVECGAGQGNENAYHVGYVSGKEASALGANFMFNPVVDIYKNWRNTIVNTRAFSDDKDVVLANARAYIKGIKDANKNMAVAIKHFPGDGVEELDQHLAMGVNNLSVNEWEESFGYVYRSLINDGVEAIMVGHIALPNMTRKLIKGIEDKDIKPATLSQELLEGILRKEMGFNGVIITDASHMIGLAATEKRCNYVPGVIKAGCDMFLFTNDNKEDISYVKKALEDGRLSIERLNDAVYRVLALKAHLHLYKEEIRIPSEEGLSIIGSEEFKKYSEQAAEECITLVKDTRHYLPLDIKKKRRCYLVYVGTLPNSRAYKGDETKDILIEELQKKGFEVDVCPSFHDLEVKNGPSFMNMLTMMNKGECEKFKAEHDFALLVINVKGYAQENWVRIRWSCNHSRELPWYNEEIPTIAMSLNYTNHLIDIPQVHTYINAYAPTRAHIAKAIEKMLGESEFKGKAQENVFCDRWDTRL
ncbi:MAG: glycoside hydrolase family 3 N-terminal domain-containing protein [Bacilli bacterium]|nr:glycoside hydrolase family 3 N-terminal domain-containing protein [Bacilli bacterium]